MTNKKKKLRFRIVDRVWRWFMSWVYLAESIVGILTFSFYRPDWVFRVLCWRQKIELKRDIKNEGQDQ